MRTLHVRYFAGARNAAGVAEEQLDVADEASVADVLLLLGQRRGPDLVRVLTACSFLLDGLAVHDHATAVTDRAELDVLPPFAGG